MKPVNDGQLFPIPLAQATEVLTYTDETRLVGGNMSDVHDSDESHPTGEDSAITNTMGAEHKSDASLMGKDGEDSDLMAGSGGTDGDLMGSGDGDEADLMGGDQ